MSPPVSAPPRSAPPRSSRAASSSPGRSPAPRARREPGRHRSLGAALAALPTVTTLTVLVAVLCAVGVVMVGTASVMASISVYGSSWVILAYDLVWTALGALVFVGASRVDHHLWGRLSGLMVVATFALLVAVLVPGIGKHVLGSSRWIGIGQIHIQPSEVMKFALCVFGADLVARRRAAAAAHRRITGPLLLVTVVAAVLVLLQPDMGTAMILVCIALALLFGSGVPVGPILKFAAIGAVGALILALSSSYRRQRLLAFFGGSTHTSTSGYQVAQSLRGLGAGHLFGLGLGNGNEQWGFLPNAHTDFIFSVIGQDFGLAGTIAVILLFGAFTCVGLRVALRAGTPFGSLLALGLVAWIASEAIINVCAVCGLLPVTGIPLPFISFGGSALLLTMLAAGVLVNIARSERRPPGAGRPHLDLLER